MSRPIRRYADKDGDIVERPEGDVSAVVVARSVVEQATALRQAVRTFVRAASTR